MSSPAANSVGASVAPRSKRPSLGSLAQAIDRHWLEYLIEGCGLGLFMISACFFGVFLEHPASFVRLAVPDAALRRVLGGLAMGLTAIAIIYSRWGKRSGAHINPAVTLTFWRLGKIETEDAVFYVLAQFAGGLAGVLVSWAALGERLGDSAVNFVVTVPGASGPAAAFLAELAISGLLMGVILSLSNSGRFGRYTGLCAGLLVATYISLEAPLSGMSMNPARTFGSACPAGVWTALWIYFLAPPLGMLVAAAIYRSRRSRVLCAKLHHQNQERCIFRCGF